MMVMLYSSDCSCSLVDSFLLASREHDRIAAICWVCIVLIGDTLDVDSYLFNRECKQLCLFTILKLYSLKIISL